MDNPMLFAEIACRREIIIIESYHFNKKKVNVIVLCNLCFPYQFLLIVYLKNYKRNTENIFHIDLYYVFRFLSLKDHTSCGKLSYVNLIITQLFP